MKPSKLLRRQHGKPCYWCGRPMQVESRALHPTRDHVKAQTYGGTGGRNLVWSCFCCNQMKGDMTKLEWAEFRANNPEWWQYFDFVTYRGKDLYNVDLRVLRERNLR